MTNIWAFSKNVPGKTCEDARLLGGGTNIQYPDGNDRGQAGWDIGLMFENFKDLDNKLSNLKWNKQISITRLAINVHGEPGMIDANSDGVPVDFAGLIKNWGVNLNSINGLLEKDANVLIMGCNLARGNEGKNFLNNLSSQVFRNHKVVGFTTTGTTMQQTRIGERCSEPGMRDTDYETGSIGLPKIQLEREKENKKFPWANEYSPHAKISLNGKIIFGDEPEVPPTNYAVDEYLPGTWNVTIGIWNGYFVFQKDKKVYWTGNGSQTRNYGSWNSKGNTCFWEFDNDSPGFKRQFEVSLPLKSFLSGRFTNKSKNNQPMGLFDMSKVT